ncbi:MAG: EAL domain-containing protein [Candidatus Gracilibacteria bacterium]|nr:EAL domain-containing protein [Candidatus Gracilibacteria bacterium]
MIKRELTEKQEEITEINEIKPTTNLISDIKSQVDEIELYPKFDKLCVELDEQGSNFINLIEKISLDVSKINHILNIEDVIVAFLSYFKERYPNFMKFEFPEKMKKILFENNDIHISKKRYIEVSLQKILNDNKIRFYEQVTFILLLLGAPEGFELMNDLKNHSSEGLNKILEIAGDNILVRTYDIKGYNLSEKHDKILEMDRLTQEYILLCETINKIALSETTDMGNDSNILSKVAFLDSQIKRTVKELAIINHKNETIDKLECIRGKLKINFSYLNSSETGGKPLSAEAISRKIKEIRDGLKIFRRVNYGDNPNLKKEFSQYWRGNSTLIRLKGISVNNTSATITAKKNKLIRKLIKIYNSSKSDSITANSSELVDDFMKISESNGFKVSNSEIETVYHIVNYCRLISRSNDQKNPEIKRQENENIKNDISCIDLNLLIRLATFLIDEKNTYENFSYEMHKINTLEAIISKIKNIRIRNTREISVQKDLNETLLGIIAYIELNKSNSNLIIYYSKIYLSIALLYSNYENHQIDAIRYFNIFLKTVGEKTEGYEKEIKEFYDNIGAKQSSVIGNDIRKGGKIKFYDIKMYLDAIQKIEIMADVQRLIDSLHSNDQNTFEKINDDFSKLISKKVFEDICMIEIKQDCDNCIGKIRKDCARCTRFFKKGGFQREKLSLSFGYSLIFEFPITGAERFYDIFNREKQFISERLGTLLSINIEKEDLIRTKSELESKKTEMEHRYYHSEYTGLLNLKKLREDLSQYDIDSPETPKISLIRIDLGNTLEDIRMNLGEGKRMEIIMSFINEVKASFSEGLENNELIFYKLEKNEFAILIKNHSDLFYYSDKIKKIIENLGNVLNPLIGIVKEDNNHILEKSIFALKMASKSVKRIGFYDADYGHELKLKSNLEDMERAINGLRDDLYEPFFQGIMDNKTGKIVKYEVLARLKNPDTGEYISPFRFMDHIEKAKKGHELTVMIFRKAVNIMLEKENLEGNYEFSQNIGGQDLENEDFFTNIRSIIIKSGIDPTRITFEVLENIEGYQFVEHIGHIKNLKDMGCKNSVDDHGSGSSNDITFGIYIDALGDEYFPEYVKIDRGMIEKLVTVDREHGEAIRNEKAIARLKNMVNNIRDQSKIAGADTKIIAEYIENKFVQEIIDELGIEYSQGFLFSKPASSTHEASSNGSKGE